MIFSSKATGVIHDAATASADEKIAFVCGVCQTSTGAIFASCQLASAKSAPDSHLGLFRSRDQGRTWQRLPGAGASTLKGTPGSIASGDIMDIGSGRLMLISTWYDRSDPERPLFDPVTEGLLKSKVLKAFSSDEGETWSAWEEVPLQGLTGVATSGGLLIWPDGSIGISFESFKHYDEVEGRPHASWILRSFDRGETFSELSQVTSGEGGTFYWDQRLCAKPRSGEYLGLFWTHDRHAKVDLPVHFKSGCCGELESPQSPEATGIVGQISAITLLRDETVLACVVNRNRPAKISLWQSHDRGATWPDKCEFVVYNHEEKARLSQGTTNIDFAQYWEDMGKWTFGHPSMLVLPDQSLLVIYYAGFPGELNMFWKVISEN